MTDAGPPTRPAAPLPGASDTIAAIATAPGRGAIAMLRVSGPDAHAIARRVVSPWPVLERVATLARCRHPHTDETLDQAMITVFAAPRSFTGEPMVELTTHGGLLVPAAVLAALLAAGARQALPGEFTRRAVLAGKLDLLQAEAAADLVDARSHAMHRAAIEQLDGGLSRRVLALRDRILDLEALIAYDIDFPEEDEGPVPRERIARAIADAREAVASLLATAPTGALVREGALVVIAGEPNAGKSSLFNALLGERRAIVTEIPGTTRDALEAVVDAGRWPLRLVDTAGLRESGDVVERLGIEVSERYLGRAEVVLACGETRAARRRVLGRLLDGARARPDSPIVVVPTKADHAAFEPPDDEERRALADADAARRAAGAAPIRLASPASAEHGEGLAALLDTLAALLDAGHVPPAPDAPLLTRERHRLALDVAHVELAAFEEAWRAGALPATVAAVHLRAGVGALEELVGAVDVEDVLERVFRSFCVGK
ncbi:MAG TPA: tRNA uridine-5-carboxymethylaminomethyl(34) synthesis GTPase MnmE [Gemmatimonadaceae bacterium]